MDSFWGSFIIGLSNLTFFYPNVLANSSWQWLTSNPKDFLPIAVILTLAIEFIGVLYFSTLEKNWIVWLKAIGIIVAANLLSFVFPYVFRMAELQSFYGAEWAEAWNLAFSTGPYYIILYGYLTFTTLIEVPIVYYTIKKHTTNPKRLVWTIIIVNCLTTALVAIIERTLYYGQW
ncbi:hypothetical protein [Jeotgalibacillus proteolyticus]|uniref:hypothetical protein n=1 Tax=Jeotgalibacillus proteolyticus TaxID=2082395 RepID=UPI001073AC49|nr:hypothetical protein [Jeotgalibacillus proteolyticus]